MSNDKVRLLHETFSEIAKAGEILDRSEEPLQPGEADGLDSDSLAHLVSRLVLRGKTAVEISEQLGLTIGWVKKCITKIKEHWLVADEADPYKRRAEAAETYREVMRLAFDEIHNPDRSVPLDRLLGKVMEANHAIVELYGLHLLSKIEPKISGKVKNLMPRSPLNARSATGLSLKDRIDLLHAIRSKG